MMRAQERPCLEQLESAFSSKIDTLDIKHSPSGLKSGETRFTTYDDHSNWVLTSPM